MTMNLHEMMTSLAVLMKEETAQLRVSPYQPDLEECAAAKARLASDLANATAKRDRETPGWREALDNEEREMLGAAARRLSDAAKENADVLKRQLDLSGELMDALLASAKKGRKGGVSTYGESGSLSNSKGGPVSVNASL